MTTGWLALGIVGAVLVFWMLGAYNRLVAMRNQIGAAWAKVDEARQQRAAGLTPLLQALDEPLTARHSALDEMAAAHAATEAAAAAMGPRPVSMVHALAWTRAESTLAAAASRVFALVEVDPMLQQSPGVLQGSAVWNEAGTRLAFARQLYNDAADGYDEAIAAWPTRLLVRRFSFAPAGRL
ncbi:MAG: LemA family protein [Rubrivivax sp.]